MEEKIHKPYSKYRVENNGSNFNLNFNTLKPYLAIFAIYVLILFIIILIFDKILMPNLVFDKKIVSVPNLVGMNLNDAIKKLQSIGLEYKIGGQLFSEKFPENTILSQTPQESLSVKQGRTIYLSVSKGNQKVEVPNLVGMTTRTAKIELMKQGLQFGNVAYDYSDLMGKDTIIYQNLQVGSMVPYGTEIDMVVSQGSNNNYTIPNLIGLKIDEAEKILNENGFVMGTITYSDNGTYTIGTIFEQLPYPGSVSPPGSHIDVKVSK